jgi:hypothetical protein
MQAPFRPATTADETTLLERSGFADREHYLVTRRL